MSRWREVGLPLVIGVAAFLALEQLVFRQGCYGRVLSPQGSTGMVAEAVRRVGARGRTAACEVLLVGDSRVAEGFSERESEAVLAGRGVRIHNAAVPGSTMRVWYHVIRALDAHGRRFDAVVIPVLGYEDIDHGDFDGADPASREADLRMVATLLHGEDWMRWALSFPTLEQRVRQARGALLRGFAFKHDFQALCTAPIARVHELRVPQTTRDRAIYEYAGHAERLAQAPALAPMRASSPELAQYRTEWLMWIKMTSSRRTLVARVPRGASAVPEPRTSSSSLRSMRSITLLPEDLCDDLERPELFFDRLHLNAEGRSLYTRRLSHAIADALGAPR